MCMGALFKGTNCNYVCNENIPFSPDMLREIFKLFYSVFNYSFQLRAALYDIHDIFFTMEASERMNILRHDREVRKEKMLRQMVGYRQESVNCSKILRKKKILTLA